METLRKNQLEKIYRESVYFRAIDEKGLRSILHFTSYLYGLGYTTESQHDDITNDIMQVINDYTALCKGR